MNEPAAVPAAAAAPAAAADPERSSGRRPWRVVILLLGLHLAFSLVVNEPGYLTYDSGTYHFMVKTFAETGGFTVRNGYEELPSPALVVAQLRTPTGELVAQYPETYTFLALPFYLVMGYPGLIFINAFDRNVQKASHRISDDLLIE